jgi:hypothetical protein
MKEMETKHESLVDRDVDVLKRKAEFVKRV